MIMFSKIILDNRRDVSSPAVMGLLVYKMIIPFTCRSIQSRQNYHFHFTITITILYTNKITLNTYLPNRMTTTMNNESKCIYSILLIVFLFSASKHITVFTYIYIGIQHLKKKNCDNINLSSRFIRRDRDTET